MTTHNEYRVGCTGCGWRGTRHARDCECYEDWILYCRPDGPGPGCPSWVTWPCPKGCLYPKPDGTPRPYLFSHPDSMVIVTSRPQWDREKEAWIRVPDKLSQRRMKMRT